MLEVLREDYVRTARAKGLPHWHVVLVHALRNALIPVITVIGLQVGLLLSGAILTETIFSWPGVGNWLIHGVQSRDYPVVQGGILLIATIVISVNLIVDLLYGVINPRIRHAHERRAAGDRRADVPRRRRPRAPLREFWQAYCAEPRRADRPRADRRCWSCSRSSPTSSRRIRRTSSTASSRSTPPVWHDGGSCALPPRHRPGRPRHPLAPDLRHAAVAADRPRSRWRSRCRSASCSG